MPSLLLLSRDTRSRVWKMASLGSAWVGLAYKFFLSKTWESFISFWHLIFSLMSLLQTVKNQNQREKMWPFRPYLPLLLWRKIHATENSLTFGQNHFMCIIVLFTICCHETCNLCTSFLLSDTFKRLVLIVVFVFSSNYI